MSVVSMVAYSVDLLESQMADCLVVQKADSMAV